jgi:hypothetical protein
MPMGECSLHPTSRGSANPLEVPALAVLFMFAIGSEEILGNLRRSENSDAQATSALRHRSLRIRYRLPAKKGNQIVFDCRGTPGNARSDMFLITL